MLPRKFRFWLYILVAILPVIYSGMETQKTVPLIIVGSAIAGFNAVLAYKDEKGDVSMLSVVKKVVK